MLKDNLNDLYVFMVVAEAQSFTRAAAKLSLSQSAVSRVIRGLEERLGVRLLTRTTRSVSPTQAGQRLLDNLVPRFQDIDFELNSIFEFRDKPTGTIRISTSSHAANAILLPKLEDFLNRCPDVSVELIVDHQLTDIVAQRFDAGIRLGEQVEKDMIAVRIGPEMRFVVVVHPDYFKIHDVPLKPQDLTQHSCINIWLESYGGKYAWEFEKDGEELRVKVEGQLTVNNIMHVKDAVLRGFGLAMIPEDLVQDELERGDLVQVLSDWSQPFPGFHLYYPSRRQPTAAFSLMVDALRWRN